MARRTKNPAKSADLENPAKVSARELGRLLGLSDRSVRDLAARGVVARDGRGRYPLEASVASYCAHLREMAAGRAGDDGSRSLVSERARLAKAQADEREAKLAAMRRELLPAGEVLEEWSSVLRQVRAGMLAVPSRVRQRLGHLTADDAEVIDSEIRDVLSELASDAS